MVDQQSHDLAFLVAETDYVSAEPSHQDCAVAELEALLDSPAAYPFPAVDQVVMAACPLLEIAGVLAACPFPVAVACVVAYLFLDVAEVAFPDLRFAVACFVVALHLEDGWVAFHY